jgi:hypothetical protein
MDENKPDEVSIQNPIDCTKFPLFSKKWRRKNYGDMPWDRGIRTAGEIEVNRDMDKPLQQLASDIHEIYFRWEKDNRDKSFELKQPVNIILFALARTASMNAKVALETRRLGERLNIWTVLIGIFTIILFLLEVFKFFPRN